MNTNIFKSAIAALALLVGINFFGCNSKPQANTTNTTVTETCDSNLKISANDKLEIEKLFRDMMYWSFNDTAHINILPILTDDKDSICVGVDFQELETTAQQLKNTGFFSQSFIDNYKRLITELDKRIRNNYYGYEWSVYELPPFRFGNDVGEFCNCQDIVTVDSMSFISEDPKNVEAFWYTKWSEMHEMGNCKFEKEQGHWKISYLWGFDYENGIKEL